MNSERPRTSVDHEWRARFASELFHRLSQPLTALNCSLDLCLRLPRSKDEYAAALRTALQLTQQAIQITNYTREVALADDPGECVEVDLSQLVDEVLEDLTPVAGAKGIVLRKTVAPGKFVQGNREKLRVAFFRLLGTALDRSDENATLSIELSVADEITLHTGSESVSASSVLIDLGEDDGGYTLCAHSVRALGGSMKKRSGSGEDVVIYLPQTLSAGNERKLS